MLIKHDSSLISSYSTSSSILHINLSFPSRPKSPSATHFHSRPSIPIAPSIQNAIPPKGLLVDTHVPWQPAEQVQLALNPSQGPLGWHQKLQVAKPPSIASSHTQQMAKQRSVWDENGGNQNEK